MHFHANSVSTTAFGDGDYYQATFQAEQDTDDPDSPYLLIQRRFGSAGPNVGQAPIPRHQLHTAATVPAAVLGPNPVVIRRIGRVWGSGLARGPLGAPGEHQHD
jgi:hypothetical protein